MKFSIGFKDLPFEPENFQVIYIESAYDDRLNEIIKNNYDALKKDFKYWGFSFVYLPLYFKEKEVEDRTCYTAPYLSLSVIKNIEKSSSYLLNFMTRPENRTKVLPSLICCPNMEGDEWIFKGFTFDLPDANAGCCLNIAEITKKVRDIYSANDSDNIRFRIVDDIPKTPEDKEIKEILDNLEVTVRKLRLRGIALSAIREFIDEQEPLSPLVITEDLRLFLPLYNNIEIELSAQKKALYFLFLNHPEGIVLQHLGDYHNELVNYYKQTNNGVLTPKMEESIRKLETYGNNQLHVVIARIREAFCVKFDERLARNYFIRGEKGQPYIISLDQELIKWED